MGTLSSLDSQQVIKMVYDSATQSFTMVPAHVGTTVLLDAVPASTNVTSAPVSILAFKVAGVVVSWTGLNAVNGTIQFMGSVDGSVYENIGSATTLASAAGHQSFSLIDEPYQYFTIVYTHGTNTTGSVTAKYILRA